MNTSTRLPNKFVFSLFGPAVSEDVHAVERVERLLGPGHHALFRLAHPDARVVELLVGLVSTLGISDLHKESGHHSSVKFILNSK